MKNRYLVLTLLLLANAACRHGQPPGMPLAWEPTVASLRQAKGSARQVSGFSAALRLTYFGPEGRLRTDAQLLVLRPHCLRYDLQGPHGGVVLAVAMDGHNVAAVDFRTSKFSHGAATAAQIDALLGLPPLGLDAPGWVDLLFGEIDLPASGVAQRRGNVVALSWQAGGQRRQAHTDLATGLLLDAALLDGAGSVLSTVEILGRDAASLPTSLRLSSGKTEVEVRLREVEYDPSLNASVFALSAPRGFADVSLVIP